jgi:hypothetical protein
MMKSLIHIAALLLCCSTASYAGDFDEMEPPTLDLSGLHFGPTSNLSLLSSTPSEEPTTSSPDEALDLGRSTLGELSARPAGTLDPSRTFNSPLDLGRSTLGELSTSDPGRSRWVDKWTWMHTNEGVKPFKVMDDLTFVGVPVFFAGMLAKAEKKAFRQNDGTKHVLLTSFRTHIDDYTQFFGPALTVGLKVGGVEGRSDWGRFLASSFMSYGFMIGFVNALKYTTKELRPDGTTHNSWPSGHTATAFVGATLLHKEYGLTRSPWYSVAGYGVATATGIMRVLNNRHWVSDVLSGAGIGMVSTELGYALSDVIFKGRGLLNNNIDSVASIVERPSFFAISMGMGWGSRHLDFHYEDDEITRDLNLRFRTSTMVNVEGAYFFNKYIGIGGRLRVNASPINGWDRVLDFAQNDVADMIREMDEDADLAELNSIVFNDEGRRPEFTIESDHLTEFAADLGPYVNIPLSRHFALGTKLLFGRSIMQELNLKARFQGNVKALNFTVNDDKEIDLVISDALNDDGSNKTYDTSWDYFVLDANNSWKAGTGISLTYAYKNNFSFRVFADYDFTRKTYTLEYNPSEFLKVSMPDMLNLYKLVSEGEDLLDEFNENMTLRRNRHTFTLGASFAVSF